MLKQLGVILCGFWLAASAYAADNVERTSNTSIALYFDGGDEILAEVSLRPQWHIYWKNPGEIGRPTTISADNSMLTVLNQSVPKVRTVHGFMNEYFYEDTVYFLLQLNSPYPRELTFEFVECNDICKPESLSFALEELSVTDAAVYQNKKTEALRTFPQKVSLSAAVAQNNSIELDLPPQTPLTFIPAEMEAVLPDSIEIKPHNSGINISWQNAPEQKLKEALIITPQRAYSADIDYTSADTSLLYIILLAFLGGIILNAMPCVFPILSLKIFTLLNYCRLKHHRWRNAFCYTAGVMLCFMFLTTCLLWLKGQGEALGWGFQLQSPWFTSIMAVLFLLLFLFMVEWLSFPNVAGRFIHKAAALNEFSTGFFAVLVASPCTGPFMGAAIGYAFMHGSTEIYSIFAALALGYALPYALIEIYPQLLSRILPRPGAWMRKVKIVLSIPILLTSLWLTSVWLTQISHDSGEESLGMSWQEYDEDLIAELNSRGENIFIDFTADWCLTCKFNEKIIINSNRFRRFVKENNVHLFVADLTENDPRYAEALSMYGRDGIPLYIYYHGGEYKILPLFFSVSSLPK